MVRLRFALYYFLLGAHAVVLARSPVDRSGRGCCASCFRAASWESAIAVSILPHSRVRSEVLLRCFSDEDRRVDVLGCGPNCYNALCLKVGLVN